MSFLLLQMDGWECQPRDVEDAVPYGLGIDRAYVGVGLLDDPMGANGWKMGSGKTKLPAPATARVAPT